MRPVIKIRYGLSLLAVAATTAYAVDSDYTATWTDANAETGFFELEEGNRLRYLKTGSGEPLLLLHTIRTQLDYFEKLIPVLSPHNTVYALDLPGHGHSAITMQSTTSAISVTRLSPLLIIWNLRA